MVRVLDAGVVDQLIDHRAVLESIRQLFSLPADPDQLGYGRIDLAHPHGWLRALPAFITSMDLLGFKVLHRTDGVGMRYTIYVHRMSTGELVGIVDALEVTNIRTGAVSAVATEHLGPSEVRAAAIVGTGPVGRGQLRALELVRPAAEIRVFARTPENRTRFVSDMADEVSGHLVEAASLDEALDGADLVTLATKALAPVFRQRHLRAGMHVNSVGPASQDRVEVDPEIFLLFDRIVCDSVEGVLEEAGDAHLAVVAHHLTPDRVEGLGALVQRASPGRVSPQETTLFKSVGTGTQDLVVAAQLLDAAEAAGMGTVLRDVNSIKPTMPGG